MNHDLTARSLPFPLPEDTAPIFRVLLRLLMRSGMTIRKLECSEDAMRPARLRVRLENETRSEQFTLTLEDSSHAR